MRRLKIARIALLISIAVYLAILALDALQIVGSGIAFWIGIISTAGIAISAALCVAFWVANLGQNKHGPPQS